MEAIEDKYPGGYSAFREIIPSEVYYKYENLLAVGFTNPDEANQFVLTLEKLGFTNKDVAYLSQIKGKVHPSSWIKIKEIEYQEEWRFIMVAYFKEGEDYHDFVAPAGWKFECSLSDDYIVVPVDCNRLEIIRNDLGLRKIYDRIQGYVVYSADM